jgi:hypothetical protein
MYTMLKHQEQAEEQPHSASQVRVTPDELVQAVAAVEARNDAVSKHEAETIPLGEAVHQLGLNATPEELLAEIRARRMQTIQAQTLRPEQKTSVERRWKRTLLRAGVALSLAANALLLAYLFTQTRITAAPAVEAPSVSVNVPLPNIPAPVVTISGIPGGSGDMTLSGVESGSTAYATRDALYQITHEEKWDQIDVYGNQELNRIGGPQWPIVRQGDKIVVKGYSVSDADQPLTDFSPIKVNQNQHPLTIPVERLKKAMLVPSNAGTIDAETILQNGASPNGLEQLNVP